CPQPAPPDRPPPARTGPPRRPLPPSTGSNRSTRPVDPPPRRRPIRLWCRRRRTLPPEGACHPWKALATLLRRGVSAGLRTVRLSHTPQGAASPDRTPDDRQIDILSGVSWQGGGRRHHRGGVGGRQRHSDLQPALVERHRADGTAVRVADRPHDRQSEPGATGSRALPATPTE